jgi:hypothetical protein
MSTSQRPLGVRSPQRRHRLWSALLGGILLVVGFRRRPADLERTNVPELAKGHPPDQAATNNAFKHAAKEENAQLLAPVEDPGQKVVGTCGSIQKHHHKRPTRRPDPVGSSTVAGDQAFDCVWASSSPPNMA